MINFTRAFDTAWERMVIILFRPFDLAKWLAIGFSAFLAGMLEGGNGLNGFNNNFSNNFNTNFKNPGAGSAPKLDWAQIHSQLNTFFGGLQMGLVIVIALLVFAFVLAFTVALYWLGARGRFLILDNIVRNRGAISWPWTNYARQANSLFWFYLLFILAGFLLLVPFAIVGIIMAIPLFRHETWPVGGELVGFIALGFVYLMISLVFSIVLFLFREFGVPLMFRHGMLAKPAFFAAMNLCRLHPGSVTVFILLRLALFVGLAIVSVIICCFTCCVGTLPYIGTVLLLPALIFIRCFSLDCLAQFGPEYDVWTVDVAPPASGLIPPAASFTPPPPRG